MRRLLLCLVLLLSLVPASVASADDDPPGDIANVDHKRLVAETSGAVAISFVEYGRGRTARDIMFVSGTFGLKSFDLSDPDDPVFLDHLPEADFRLPGDPTGAVTRAYWQNEDMNVDARRKLVFMARDPRAFDGSTSDPADVAGFYIVDAKDPEDLAIRHFEELPTGHTSTCVNDCDFIWTGGPASNTDQSDEWPLGRPIFVTDVRDLDNVVTSPDPIDVGRVDGVTGYAHDVQVDAKGIAWVSGAGGVRGYHTSGRHLDPLSGRRRVATPVDPIPYAGGGIEESAAPSSFMHNSVRPVGRTLRDGNLPSGANKPGSLIYATEEAFGSPVCDGVGVFVISSLEGSYDGEGWRSTPQDPFRLQTVGTWSPADQEGTILNAFCSAHYFEVRDSIVAYSWYAQGTRFLDVSDPSDPIQIAYFRPDGAVSYAPYFHGDRVYVADIARGVEILELEAGAYRAAGAHREVHAPAMSAAQRAAVKEIAAGFRPDPVLGWSCPLPVGRG